MALGGGWLAELGWVKERDQSEASARASPREAMGGATPLDPSASWVSRMLSRSPASRGRGAKAGDDRRDSERRSAGLSCFAEDERIRAAASLDINNTSGWELVRSTKEEIIVGDRLERTKGGVDMGAEQSINQDDHYGTAVQFSTGVYYCKEDEGRMTVDVLRIGDCSGQASVAYRTVDGSATAGIHYEAAAGVVLFNSGQTVGPDGPRGGACSQKEVQGDTPHRLTRPRRLQP